jgi:hypothetical protein
VLARGAAPAWLVRCLLAVIVIGAVTGVGSSFLAHLLEGAATWIRVAGAVILLVPLGFMLGTPLAAGLTFSAGDPAGYRAL